MLSNYPVLYTFGLQGQSYTHAVYKLRTRNDIPSLIVRCWKLDSIIYSSLIFLTDVCVLIYGRPAEIFTHFTL